MVHFVLQDYYLYITLNHAVGHFTQLTLLLFLFSSLSPHFFFLDYFRVFQNQCPVKQTLPLPLIALITRPGKNNGDKNDEEMTLTIQKIFKNDDAVVPGNILGGCPASICDILSLIEIDGIDQGYLDTCGTDIYI